jgi:hypothetical protein
MSGKLRVTYGIKGDRKTILMMVDAGSTFDDFINTVRRRNPGLVVNNVWLDASGIDLEDLISDYYDPNAIFVLSSSGEPLDAAITQYFYASRVSGRLASTFSATAPPAGLPAAPPVGLPAAPPAPGAATLKPGTPTDLAAGYIDQPHIQIAGKAIFVDDEDTFV